MKVPKGARWPVANNRVDSRLKAALPVKRKIGMYVAIGESDESFDEFLDQVARAGAHVLEEPPRLLTAPHLQNAIALKMDHCSTASKPLIEGLIQELLTRGLFKRFATFSRSDRPYNVITLPAILGLVQEAVAVTLRRLEEAGEVTAAVAARAVPKEIAITPLNVELILGHLVRLGLATTDHPLGTPIQRITVPA